MSESPKIMAILNVTPDSFSDGGSYQTVDDAVQHALSMIDNGADIIDIGGESTRPGAQPIGQEEELQRTIPVIKKLRQAHSFIPISIDTTKPIVMQQAIEAGATIINDINALQNPEALRTAASLNVPVCLMHKQGTPQTMQQQPNYQNVVSEVIQFLTKRIQAAKDAGVQQIWIDPGFGFGKTLEHNCSLFQQIPAFCQLNHPVLVGVSRKSMLAAITKQSSSTRTVSSACAALLAVQKGASIVRVHDVQATKEALLVLDALS